MRLYTYTLRIEGPDGSTIDADRLGRCLIDAEDAANDRLPEGFYCKIDQASEGVDLAAVQRLEQAARRFEEPFPTDEDRQALIEALQPRKGK